MHTILKTYNIKGVYCLLTIMAAGKCFSFFSVVRFLHTSLCSVIINTDRNQSRECRFNTRKVGFV